MSAAPIKAEVKTKKKKEKPEDVLLYGEDLIKTIDPTYIEELESNSDEEETKQLQII